MTSTHENMIRFLICNSSGLGSIAYSSFLSILKNCLRHKSVPYLTHSVNSRLGDFAKGHYFGWNYVYSEKFKMNEEVDNLLTEKISYSQHCKRDHCGHGKSSLQLKSNWLKDRLDLNLTSPGCYLDEWPVHALSQVDSCTWTSDCQAPGQVPSPTDHLVKCQSRFGIVPNSWFLWTALGRVLLSGTWPSGSPYCWL